MNKKTRHIVFVLLSLFLCLIAEKAIPHSHVEHDGIILPDWENKENASHEDEEGEKLHSNFYQLSSFDYLVQEVIMEYDISIDCNTESLLESIKIPDYNILPKVLNNILFIVHTCSSTAPPLNC